MPKRQYDPDGDDYGEVYGNVYGKTKKIEQDKDGRTYGESTNVYGSSKGSSGQTSAFLKCFVFGFSVATIACFSAAFVLIMQLRQEVTQLQNSPTGQESSDTTNPVTQPPPFTATLGTTRSLPAVEDRRVAAALRQLNDADTQIRDGFEKMSEEFRSLQEWTQQSISQSSKKIDDDLCGLENLLEQWALPVDTVGALLSLEGWTRAYEGLYIKLFVRPSKSYANAKLECEKLGAKLASKSLNHIAKTGKHLSNSWIGYDDIQSEGLWTWSDGTTGFYPNSLQWRAGQPDNNNGAEDCAYISGYAHGKYLLNDNNCLREINYVCEKDTTSLLADGVCQ